ncbi:tubulin epsilon and delta complex protein 1 isoform X2 [Microcaecilia unicolor]|uniref:Tubulin epsilon and delta complex protein 1 isoform X2 n=1 Tax=Microcaecilia unicolor TaxID=1415580 RepID=A0A6P7Z630_9AMPH|nr:tubulin epsilon and delta complex protein 1 isoform X2 [Microcaecilia unicolor]XP_030071184.1 tubulin epsilon and delta complex protein 1 isoform X2 [Microcaecilia unicolor]
MTAEFWKLLYGLLKKVCGARTSDLNDENIDAQIRFVKSVLWYYGYGILDFYHLPYDGSQGSRELLLAFSWLLHTQHVLEKLLEANKIRVGDEISVCMCDTIKTVRCKSKEETALPFSQRGETDIRYLQWLNGKLRFCWRTLHTAKLEEVAVLHKIHLYTRGCHIDPNINHLSVTETDLLRQPENCNKLVKLLESENSRLKAYLEWKRVESVYWQWMESVLDCKLEEARSLQLQNSRNENNTLQIAEFCRGNVHTIGEVEKLNNNLVRLHDELEEIVSCKKVLWNEKVKAREKELLNMREFCATVMKIEQEVKKKTEDLKYHCTHIKTEMHGSYRLVFKDDKAGFTKSVNRQSSVDVIKATEVLSELRRKEVKLEKEFKKLQKECRKKLDEIAESMDGVICIPPIKKEIHIEKSGKGNLT